MGVRSIAKTAVFQFGRCSGINAISRRRHKRRLLTLCYHGVVPDEHVRHNYLDGADSYLHRNAISVARFREQLKTLTRSFHPVSAEEVLDWREGKNSLPENAVLVTFDDGFRNNFQHAAPLLEEAGIPALFNLPTGYIGTARVLWTIELDALILAWPNDLLPMPNGSPDISLPRSVQERIGIAEQVRSTCKRIPDTARTDYIARLKETAPLDAKQFDEELVAFMSWAEVRDLKKRGFSFGSHSVNHPILSSLTPEALTRELGESKSQLEEELGVSCPFLTYPNGSREDFSSEVIGAAEKVGYRAGFSLVRSFTSQDTHPFEIGRYCITADATPAEFSAIVSGLYSYLPER